MLYAMYVSLCTMVHSDVYIVAYQEDTNRLGSDKLPTERSKACSERFDKVRSCKLHITQTESSK